MSPNELKNSGNGRKIWQELGIYAVVSLAAAVISFLIFDKRGITVSVLQGFYLFFLFFFVSCIINPCSFLYDLYLKKDKTSYILIGITFIFICALCTLPMRINPYWNGQGKLHWNQRNQYEELADALLEGHLDIHHGEDFSGLLALENPYDVDARNSNGVDFYWDHAFYKGHYYVYFGIVPALILFVPHKLIMGFSLTAWKATAIFSVFIIAAVFLIGQSVIRKLKSQIPLMVYLSVCSGISFFILWYAVKYPALYCTAITGGVCFCLWSFYFYFQAFYVDEKPHIWKIVLAALLGALVFGCRPPVGLMEVAVFPLVFFSFHMQIKEGGKEDRLKVIKQGIALVLPYIIVAVLLMVYNYVRFDNPFEFGQTYQLTSADQSDFASLKGRVSLIGWMNYTLKYLFEFNPFTKEFPWVNERMGMMILFPVSYLVFLKWRLPETDKKLKWLHIMLLTGCMAVIECQVLSSPFGLTRYWMDFSFALGLVILFWTACAYNPGNPSGTPKRWFSVLLVWLSLLVGLVAFLEFFTQGDGALADIDVERMNTLSRFFVFRDMIN